MCSCCPQSFSPFRGSHMDYKKKLEELYVDEEEILSDLVEKSKFLLGISKKSGDIFFKIPLDQLNDYQKIILYMMIAIFLKDMGKRDSEEVTNQELIDFLKKRKEAVGSRLSELRKMNKIKSKGTGKNILVPIKVIEDIDEMVELVTHKE